MPAARLRQAFAALDADPDADLLRRFAADRCPHAFAALVRRHGPMVLGVCRRVVPDAHLADDAFQAAFVVLARRAAGLDASRPLGPWLYGVAHRVALRARTMLGRRRKRETLTAKVPDTLHTPAGEFDTPAILDDEIGKLSAALRDAVILCELQGLSRREAAAKLGIAEGTLSSRLAAARKALAAALRARGVDLLAAAVTAGTGTIPPLVASLADGASAMTLFHKLTTAAVLGVLLLAGGFGLWKANDTDAAPVPKAEKDDGIFWTLDGKTGTLTAFAPDGTKKQEVELKDGSNFRGFNHDGSTLRFLANKGRILDDEEEGDLTLHFGKPSDLAKATDTGFAITDKSDSEYALTHDEKRILRIELTQIGTAGPNGQPMLFRHTLIDLKDKKETALEVPASMKIISESADGKEWVVWHSNDDDPKLPGYRFLRLPKSGGKPISVCDDFFLYSLVPSPDGQTYLATGVPFPLKGKPKRENLYHLNPATGRATKLERFDPDEPHAFCWSPDGKRYAIKPHGDADVYVVDIDGTNRKKLFTIPKAGPKTRLLGWFPSPKAKAEEPKAKPPEKREPIKAPVPKAKERKSGESGKDTDRLW
jgi:RNA polymerase sigma factor (sigma-70 family)